MLISTKMSAQFDKSNYPNPYVGAAQISPKNTGNDILDFGGNTYRVSVWDDVVYCSPGIAWDVDYSSNNYQDHDYLAPYYIPYCSTCGCDVKDPDVALVVDDGGNVFAVVAYYYSGHWYEEDFEWSSYWLRFISNGANSLNLVSASFGTTVNIDANFVDGYDGDIVVVWDEGDYVHAKKGTASSGSVTFSPNTESFSGHSPDVSIFFNDPVHICYIDGYGDWLVDDYALTDIDNGSGSATNVLSISPPNGGTYYYPRIACSSQEQAQTGGDWTSVIEERKGSDYWIEGYNYNSNYGFTGITCYNNYTTGPPSDISNVQNNNVAVCYDNNYPNNNGIWVGWTMDNTAGYHDNEGDIYNDTRYPIVVKCDQFAVPYSGLNYWNVPYNMGTENEADFLSLAGRYTSDNVFLTFWTLKDEDVVTKTTYPYASYTAGSSLRTTGNSGSNTIDINNLFDSGIQGYLTLKLFDLDGKLISKFKGTEEGLRSRFRLNLHDMPASIYLVQIISDDGSYYRSQKIYCW